MATATRTSAYGLALCLAGLLGCSAPGGPERFFAATVDVVATASPQASAEEVPTEPAESDPAAARDRKSDFEDVPEFGGESSTGVQLKTDDVVVETVFRTDGLQRLLAPWFDFKKRLNENHGLAIGTDYTGLYYKVSESPGEDDAASGDFRLFGSWTLLGRGTENTGSVVFKVENRHALGTEIPVSALGFESGYAGLVGPPFNDRGWMLTNLYWQQKTSAGRLNFLAGIVDATDYIDLYGMISPWLHFNNLVFTTGSGAMPVPDQGLGAALGASLSENLYLVTGLADANGDPTDPGDAIDTFFDDHEFFKHVELGWTTSFEERYLNNVHLTFWHADERDSAGVPDGWGANLSAAHFFDGAWMPFLRAGWSDDGGALLERSVSTGLGYYMRGRSDLLGIGLNWGRPSETGVGPGLDDQYTAELFYRLQLSANFAITPDVQYVIDPALAPAEDALLFLGVRARLAF